MRGVEIHLSYRDRLPWAVLGLYLLLRYVVTSPGFWRSLGVSMTSEDVVGKKGDAYHGRVS